MASRLTIILDGHVMAFKRVSAAIVDFNSEARHAALIRKAEMPPADLGFTIMWMEKLGRRWELMAHWVGLESQGAKMERIIPATNEVTYTFTTGAGPGLRPYCPEKGVPHG